MLLVLSPASSSIARLGRPDAGWTFTLYPDAREGGGSFGASLRTPREYIPAGSAADPDRAAEEAGRRARARLRRYCAANLLNRLGTLTYRGEGCHDPALVREHIGTFFRDLRERLGSSRFPFVWVPEWHKTGHCLHVHFAVGRFVKRSVIESAWPHGFVHIKLLGDLPSGAGTLTQARIAARYLSKYVAKSFTDPDARVLGLHLYDVAQGFTPGALRLAGRSAVAVLAEASELMSGPAMHEWGSSEVEDWEGPPAIWAQWGA